MSIRIKDSPSGKPLPLPVHVFLVLVILSILTVTYYDTVSKLFNIWITSEDDSHGLILVGLALYYLYKEKNFIRSSEKPLWFPGIFIIITGIATYSIGMFATEYYLERTSLVVLLVGITAFLYGKRISKALTVPFFLLFMSIPLPAIIVNSLTLRLKLFVSAIAADMLRLCGIFVYQDGNILQLPGITLEVVTACSGIRSIFALFVLSLIFSLDLNSKLQRVLLVLMTFPLAIFTNAFRITLTGFLDYYASSEVAMKFYHGFSGWLIFGIALALMMMSKWIILYVSNKTKQIRK